MSVYDCVRLLHADSIRLLRIDGFDADRVLQLSLLTDRLGNEFEFWAMSYTWRSPLRKPRPGAPQGPEDAPRFIKCNSHTMQVGGNLYSALLRFAKPDFSSRLFWIDALCVNQQDDSERGEQVALMASVYGKATCVIIWLGPEDEHTVPALALMESLFKRSRAELMQITETSLSTNAAVPVLLGEKFRDVSYWQSLARFFCRSWFTRAWVVPEALMAQRILVLCGDHAIEWDKLTHVAGYLATGPWTRSFSRPGFLNEPDLEPHHGGPAKLAAAKRALVQGENTQHVLLYGLIRSRKYECLYEVDKVYSLLGMTRAHAPPTTSFPQPIYGIPTREVYIQTAISILEADGDLLLLCCAEGPAFRRVPDLPSWVPDWSVTDLVGLGITGYKRFDAAAGRSRCLRVDKERSILEIEAYQLDLVAQVGESKQDVDMHSVFDGWLNILEVLPSQYAVTEQHIFDVLWRTLLTDTVTGSDGRPQHPAPSEFRKAFHAWLLNKVQLRESRQPPITGRATLSRLLDWLATSPLADNSPPSALSVLAADPTYSGIKPTADYYDTPFAHAVCLSLFRTEQNFVGVGSLSVQEGDTLWIVPGCRVPLMFRKLTGQSDDDSEDNSYELVGAAYLHGFMDGKEGLKRGLRSQTIQIL